MVYILTYVNYNGTRHQTEYLNLKQAKEKMEKYSKSSSYTDVRITVPLEVHEANLDYKEKFEELYNHLLNHRGIRNSPVITELE